MLCAKITERNATMESVSLFETVAELAEMATGLFVAVGMLASLAMSFVLLILILKDNG